MKCQTSLQNLQLRYNRNEIQNTPWPKGFWSRHVQNVMKYKLRSMIFKMLQKYESKEHRQYIRKHIGNTSRPHRLLAHHLHIYREGELGYSVNGASNKGFACMTSEIFNKQYIIIAYNKTWDKSSSSNESIELHQSSLSRLPSSRDGINKGCATNAFSPWVVNLYEIGPSWVNGPSWATICRAE